MKAAIILFSPSGHTLHVGNVIETVLKEKQWSTDLLDITKKPEYIYESGQTELLKKRLGGYDLLFIGGPIYAGHMERRILNIIKALPRPGSQYRGLAVPFVTYGGVHSSIALEEAGRSLKKRGYVSLLGIKVAAKHTLTPTLSQVIYPEKPGEEEDSLIRQGVKHAISLIEEYGDKAPNRSQSFRYTPLKERIMFRIFSQEKIHGKFKNVSIDSEKCIRCGKCIQVCPVDMFRISEKTAEMHRDAGNCILCAECFHHCPTGAILHPYIEIARKRLQDGKIQLEAIPSALYPPLETGEPK